MRLNQTNRPRYHAWIKGVLRGIVFVVALSLTTACAGYIIFQPQITQWRLNQKQPTLTRADIQRNVNNDHGSFNYNRVHDTSLATMMKAHADIEKHAIGMVTQPQAKVGVAIAKGIDDKILAGGAGTARPGEQMGKDNYVLGGHHVPQTSWALFSGIYYYAKPGQMVYVTDLKKVYAYQIQRLKFYPASATYITDKNNYRKAKYRPLTDIGKPMITLFSCDATGSHRIVEFGTLKHIYAVKDMPTEARKGFQHVNKFNVSQN